MLNLGLDFGNSHTKATNGTKDIIFESGYMEYPRTTGEEELERGGRFYVFGKRSPVEFDKTANDRMMLCSLYAVAQFLEITGADPAKTQVVNLGVDIPISQFGTEKKKYFEYYAVREEQVSYHGKTWNIRFETIGTYPQGVVTWAANQEKFEQYGKLVLLDIGGRTVDVAVVSHNRFSGKKGIDTRFSLQNGVIGLFGTLDGHLQAAGIQLSEADMETLLYGDTFPHRRENEIQAIVDREAKTYVDGILNRLYENGVDTQLPFALIGGGSDMMYRRLEKELNVVANMGTMANARACLTTLQSVL